MGAGRAEPWPGKHRFRYGPISVKRSPKISIHYIDRELVVVRALCVCPLWCSGGVLVASAKVRPFPGKSAKVGPDLDLSKSTKVPEPYQGRPPARPRGTGTPLAKRLSLCGRSNSAKVGLAGRPPKGHRSVDGANPLKSGLPGGSPQKVIAPWTEQKR
jgi:hypothetical protein